jgi:hypothetical protein
MFAFIITLNSKLFFKKCAGERGRSISIVPRKNHNNNNSKKKKEQNENKIRLFELSNQAVMGGNGKVPKRGGNISFFFF